LKELTKHRNYRQQVYDNEDGTHLFRSFSGDKFDKDDQGNFVEKVFEVETFKLIKSELTRQGSVYDVVAVFSAK